MRKQAVFAELGSFYQPKVNGFDTLPFVYNNVDQLSTWLRSAGWETTLAMKDEGATKAFIVQKLSDVINQCAEDDWVLFYFVGHASKYPDATDIKARKTFCVSYSQALSTVYWPSLDQFFSEDDYQTVVALFESKISKGHLVAIFDCCYADGLLNSFDVAKDFQTVIAASSRLEPAYYDVTSYLFTAFSQCWDLPMGQLQTKMSQIANDQNLDLECVIRPAKNFLTQTLKTQ